MPASVVAIGSEPIDLCHWAIMQSSLPKTVDVALKNNSYSILIDDSLTAFADSFAARHSDKHTIVISDENVAAIYLEPAVQQLKDCTSKIDTIVVPAGEPSKSINRADQIWQQLMEFGADRSCVIVALGGGVVGDLAGFIAATFMRGVPLIQVPTSLLAQVDSSVGGKTGVNLPQGKNLVGCFHQPDFVMISTSTLSTLDEANFRAGMAEVIKYGVIMDKDFFEWLENHSSQIKAREPEILAQMIATCCHCKARVVEEDERETTGRRAILNYGHTFGHAIEAVFGYGSYLHGEAIAIGMNCAAKLASSLGMFDASLIERQLALLQAFSLPTDCPNEKHSELIAAMKKDKKSSGGQVKLILPDRIGNVNLVDWPGDEVVGQAL